MSENNVTGIIGAEVTTTGIIGATVAIGQYIVNDYVITIAPVEDDYGYTMTITRGSDTQTVTLYGLSTEQYNSMLGYLQQAQEAAQNAAGSASDAYAYLELALDAANRANTQAARAEQASDTARSYASQAQTAKQGAETAKTDAQTARTQAQGYWQAAETAATRAGSAATRAETALAAAETAQSAAEAAQTAAEAAETDTQTYAGQASQSAANAAQSAASAAQTLAQVQAEGAAQIAAIDAEGQRVIDSIPEDYTEVVSDVADLKSQIIIYTGCTPIIFTHGYYINDAVSVGATVNLTPVSVPTLAYAIVDVAEGDQITINGQGWTNGRLWAFIDSENKLLSVSASTITGTNLKIIAPANSAKCIINVYVSNYGNCYKGETVQEIHNNINEETADIHDDIREFTGCENIQFAAGYYIKDNLAVGETVDLTPLGNGWSTLSCAVIPVSYGDHVTINGTGWIEGRLWAFIDSNNKLLDSAGASATGENLVLSAPKNSAKCILNVVTATAGRCYFGESLPNLCNNLTYAILEKETQDYFGNIPAKIDFTIGRRSNIYLDGLFADKDFRNKWLRMYCYNTEVKVANESITAEPTTASTGADIVFSIADKDHDVVVQKTSSVRTNSKSTGNGETKYIMIVGDSLIGNGEAASYVYSLLDEDGDYDIVQVGSLESTDSVDPTKTVKHEGRGSWSWATYINPAGESTPQYGKTNPFMHNGVLDFDNYCDTYNNGNPIDIAIISLGTNDMGQHGWETAAQRESNASAAVTNAKVFLDALLSACPNCKIAIGLPAFGSVTRNNASEDGLIAEMSCYARHMIDAYDNGKYNANITCVAHGAYIDRINGYPHTDYTDAFTGRVSRLSTNTVHPLKNGYFQWGMGYYNKIRAFLAGLL